MIIKLTIEQVVLVVNLMMNLAILFGGFGLFMCVVAAIVRRKSGYR